MSAGYDVAIIGECLIELTGRPFGTLTQSYGGDTLNTAIYLARLCDTRFRVRYVTVLGQDLLSDALLRGWQAEGIDTSLTLHDAARLPGLYQIQVDPHGERSFLYWRQDSAARYLVQHDEFARVRENLGAAQLIYLSAISLAILPDADRATLIELLRELVARGARLAYDTNYRPRLWRSAEAARACTAALLSFASLVFATFDDEQALWFDVDPQATLARLRSMYPRQFVLKLGALGCLHAQGGEVRAVPAAPVSPVVDTTAAGDSFNAGYLAAWLAGADPADACDAANALAGIVIQHPGAIVPRGAMPELHRLLPPHTLAS